MAYFINQGRLWSIRETSELPNHPSHLIGGVC